MNYPIQIFFIFLLFGDCAMSNSQKIYPLQKSEVSVVGNKIYQAGKPFAEIRFLATNSKYNIHRGFVIYYYDYMKEVWIYPSEGWQIYGGNKKHCTIKEIEDEWHKGIQQFLINNKRADKTELVSAWCYDVRISDDGKYVYYKTKGIIYDSSHKYLVEYGVSK